MKTINTSLQVCDDVCMNLLSSDETINLDGLKLLDKCVCLQVYATELLHSLKNCQCIDCSELHLISRSMILLIC